MSARLLLLRAQRVLGPLGLVAIAGCQLVAGLGDLTPNDATSSGQGAAVASSSTGAGGAGVGGGTGAGGAGGRCGDGGSTDGPSCGWLATFGVAGAVDTGGPLAITSDGKGYVGGLATGDGPFGKCSSGGCPFVQKVGVNGAAGTKTILQVTGTATMDGLGVVEKAGHQNIAFAGTLLAGATLTLPSTPSTSLKGDDGTLYVAVLSSDFSTTVWSNQLIPADMVLDPDSTVHLGTDAAGDVVVAANTKFSDKSTWGTCADSVPTNGEDIFVARFDGDTGSCNGFIAFGGLGDQEVDLLRVASDGHALIAGRFTAEVNFPSGSQETAGVGQAAYYAYLNSIGHDVWHHKFDSSALTVLGGSISASGVALSGKFSGDPPSVLTDPGSLNCGTDGGTQRGFVKSHGGGDPADGNLTDGLELCLGSTGITSVSDVAIDDDGSVVVVGVTTGAVDFDSFHVAATSPNEAFFALKLDKHGHLLWAKGSDPSNDQRLFHAQRTPSSQVLVSGLFAGKLDLGCGCAGVAKSDTDVFLADLAP